MLKGGGGAECRHFAPPASLAVVRFFTIEESRVFFFFFPPTTPRPSVVKQPGHAMAHDHAILIGAARDLLILHAPARLRHKAHAILCGVVQAVPEGKKGIAGQAHAL